MTTKDMDLECYGDNLEFADKAYMETILMPLIEKALALTGTELWEMNNGDMENPMFSYPDFFYYLLSPEFIEKYMQKKQIIIGHIGHAIYYHQKGDSSPLISLLEAI